MSICANPDNLENITSEKVDFLNKEKMNSQVNDPKMDNFGSDEANTSSSNHSTNFNCEDDSSSTDSEEDDLDDFDSDDTLDQQYAFMSQCGNKSKTIKKHAVTGKKNSSKFISTPQKFQIVNGEKFNFKLSNKVDNRLEMKNNRKQKIQEKTTFNFDVDENSNYLLSTMLQNQVLEKIIGVIGKCKEYTLFHVIIGPNFFLKTNSPKECTMKVFTPIYASDAHRTKTEVPKPKETAEKKMARKGAEETAKKELITLRRITKAHVLCPKALARHKNILFLSFIGENTKVGQCLGAVDLTDTESVVAYNQIVKSMRILFQEPHLILADLSPSNILWHDNECYFTDVNQSINAMEAYAFTSLLNVCTRLESYFSKKGITVTSNEIFKFVTDCEYGDRMSLHTLQKLKT